MRILTVGMLAGAVLAMALVAGCKSPTSNSTTATNSTTTVQDFTTDPAAPVSPPLPTVTNGYYVDTYLTNQTATTSAYNSESTNAALNLLSRYDALWTPGGFATSAMNTNYLTAYKTGTILNSSVLSANITYAANLTASRTATQAANAFFDDRRSKSYSTASTGFGPLASVFLSGSGLSTTLTSVPSDANVYAYNDSGNDYGAITSTYSLYNVMYLIQQVRASGASANPAKYYFNYPRPWRLANNSSITESSTATDTGYYAADRATAEAYYTYGSSVSVVPALLPDRSTTPYSDGGFPSGHTSESFNTGLLMAYAVPERFQEIITRSSDLGNNRILAGMHSPLDVMGGRMLGTAIAAGGLYDANNATTKANAFSTAHTWLMAQTSTTTSTFYTYAHSGTSSTDPFYDHDTNKTNYENRLTYGFSQTGTTGVAAVVPKGAEVLLETRLPYLTAAQRREVLRTTAIASGYPLLDDAEGWGRLDLFAAADGYGSFSGTIYANLDGTQVASTQNNFYALDTWKNNIGGVGRLVKQGTGTLVLTGTNTYSGGTRIEAGTLQAASTSALGTSDVQIKGGTLELNNGSGVTIKGQLQVLTGATLTVDAGSGTSSLLTTTGTLVLGAGTLNVVFTSQPATGTTITLITSPSVSGQFSSVAYSGLTTNPTVRYTSTGVVLGF